MTTIATKLTAQVLQKAFENSKTQTTPTPGEQAPFKDLLQSMGDEANFADMLGYGDGQILGGPKSQSISAESIPFSANEEGMKQFNQDHGTKFVDMLADFNQQQVQMDGLLNEVLYSDKKFNNQELLAIQAHVFHVAQMTELTVKSVELAVSSFKGVMNTQIQ